MRVSDESDTDDDSQEEADNYSMVSGRRFACDELYMSGDSDDGYHLKDKMGLAEGAMHELLDEFQLTVLEEVRSKISSLETQLVYENDSCASLTTKIDRQRDLQQERERKFDLQYQRTIDPYVESGSRTAGNPQLGREMEKALDNHLTAVQRDHEHISQLEERKIRDDAAREEAKRKEKAFQEEKLRQERIKVEEEARLKAEMAERAKAAAIEAEKQAAEEAASKRATETLRDTAQNAVQDSKATLGPSSSALDVKKEVQSSENKALKERANQNYNKHGQNIGRQIKTISATVENVRTRAEELVKLISSPGVPQSISIQLFAEKIVSNCTNQRSFSAIFAISRVIVLVTSKIPLAMDILIAELNRVCIYTIPKHISYSEEAYKTKDTYFKAIGYEEDNGKIESIDDYVGRLSCYMKLYGALVQTEVGGFQNLHGLTEGWAWLARFLNALLQIYTLQSRCILFLKNFGGQMAGFALYRRYRNQFEKLLRIVAHDFLNALKKAVQSHGARN
ncbi:hypothetical protein DH2020_003728 [Rehmannia glutinosa]|uniref:mRNA export factor GLE1 n=1 Tax=Rehmannia glutinosa TaxID=99300 RepID=A0ABR0XMG6_REHGL